MTKLCRGTVRATLCPNHSTWLPTRGRTPLRARRPLGRSGGTLGDDLVPDRCDRGAESWGRHYAAKAELCTRRSDLTEASDGRLACFGLILRKPLCAIAPGLFQAPFWGPHVTQALGAERGTSDGRWPNPVHLGSPNSNAWSALQRAATSRQGLPPTLPRALHGFARSTYALVSPHIARSTLVALLSRSKLALISRSVSRAADSGRGSEECLHCGNVAVPGSQAAIDLNARRDPACSIKSVQRGPL
jgi:hypothetical protein